MPKIKEVMDLNRECVHSVRYDSQVKAECDIPSIYIKKAALSEPYPKEITLTVETLG